MTKIGFIGGGRMAEAIIKGLLSSKLVAVSDICVSEIDASRRDFIKDTYSVAVHADNQRVVSLSDSIILAVKPQALPEVVRELKVEKKKLLISIAAGITLSFLEKSFPGAPVVRVMPNNPVLVQAGISALAAGKNVSPDDYQQAERIFSAVGEVVKVEEGQMDAVTGLSGSGPAFIYLAAEAMAAAGEELGLDKGVAQKLALHTILGAARTMLETGKSAEELKQMVISPGGTTIEGLKVLDKMKFSEALRKAVFAAAEKSKKISH